MKDLAASMGRETALGRGQLCSNGSKLNKINVCGWNSLPGMHFLGNWGGWMERCYGPKRRCREQAQKTGKLQPEDLTCSTHVHVWFQNIHEFLAELGHVSSECVMSQMPTWPSSCFITLRTDRSVFSLRRNDLLQVNNSHADHVFPVLCEHVRQSLLVAVL